ncbi:MAG: hypothetical protein HQL19_04250 [Candidatus Omnitrophica bacterium]|nr:hypothetical protein [Candidatus Omnitrophota bacterium]
MFRRIIASILIVSFFGASVSSPVYAQALTLPQPGTMVLTSPAYVAPIFKGMTVHPENPFLFDFIVDTGNSGLKVDGMNAALKAEGEKLVKYFLASVTLPEQDQWVNLSPYEKDRMLPEALAKTELGRDMLAQDYILKQVTSSLIYPERDLGKTFWARVYERARKEYGTTDVPMDVFNKVWVMADKADVYVHNNSVFVVGSHLKVMLESDYLAAKRHAGDPSLAAPVQDDATQASTSADLTQQIVREIVLPELEKEVNAGKNFANLRQMFHSMILATWYKKNFKKALLAQVYANRNKISGVERPANEIDPETIYAKYLEAFKKGAFSYIKEEPVTGAVEPLAHKYFSGGMPALLKIDNAMAEVPKSSPEVREAAKASNLIALQARLDAEELSLADGPGRVFAEQAMLTNLKALFIDHNGYRPWVETVLIIGLASALVFPMGIAILDRQFEIDRVARDRREAWAVHHPGARTAIETVDALETVEHVSKRTGVPVALLRQANGLSGKNHYFPVSPILLVDTVILKIETRSQDNVWAHFKKEVFEDAHSLRDVNIQRSGSMNEGWDGFETYVQVSELVRAKEVAQRLQHEGRISHYSVREHAMAVVPGKASNVPDALSVANKARLAEQARLEAEDTTRDLDFRGFARENTPKVRWSDFRVKREFEGDFHDDAMTIGGKDTRMPDILSAEPTTIPAGMVWLNRKPVAKAQVRAALDRLDKNGPQWFAGQQTKQHYVYSLKEFLAGSQDVTLQQDMMQDLLVYLRNHGVSVQWVKGKFLVGRFVVPRNVVIVSAESVEFDFMTQFSAWKAQKRADVEQAKENAMLPPGGIDLNAKKMTMTEKGSAAEFSVDQAMIAQFEQGHFTGFRPVVINVTPMKDLALLMGL